MKRLLTLALIIPLLMLSPVLAGAPARAQGLETATGEEFEQAFLQLMIMHHEMAVMMAQPVAERAEHDELKVLARDIIAAQSAEVAQMRAWLKDWYAIDVPSHMGAGGMMGPMGPGMDPQTGMMPGMTPDMHGGMQPGAGSMPGMQGGPTMMPGMGMDMMGMMGMDMMAMMSSLAPARLEVMFMTMMIPHHEGAIGMAQLALDRAIHPEVRTLAQNILATQSAEIGQLNQWLAEWYNL